MRSRRALRATLTCAALTLSACGAPADTPQAGDSPSQPAAKTESDEPEDPRGADSEAAGTTRVAALFTNTPPYPGVVWTNDGKAVPNQELNAIAGPEHCEWQSATMVHVGWPLGTEAPTSEQARQYVRDPHAVFPADRLQGTLERQARLPEDAAATGYRTGDIELWTSPSDVDRVIYLVGPDGTEGWPRTDPMVACK